MERARATWTDERLDDLSRRVDVGFERVDRRFDHVDSELRAVRADLGARIDAQGARIDSMQRAMLQIGGGIIAANLVAIVSLIAT